VSGLTFCFVFLFFDFLGKEDLIAEIATFERIVYKLKEDIVDGLVKERWG
jgi:hypothetical protein